MLCQRTGLIMPILPIVPNTKGSKLFSQLMEGNHGVFDDNKFERDWVSHCDGREIFPVNRYFLRSYHKKWVKNTATKIMVRNTTFAQGKKILEKLPEARELALK